MKFVLMNFSGNILADVLAFLCVSLNSTATQSTGNVVLAVLYDCKIMIAVVWFSHYFINVDFFFIPAFQIFRSQPTGQFGLECLVHLN